MSYWDGPGFNGISLWLNRVTNLFRNFPVKIYYKTKSSFFFAFLPNLKAFYLFKIKIVWDLHFSML